MSSVGIFLICVIFVRAKNVVGCKIESLGRSRIHKAQKKSAEIGNTEQDNREKRISFRGEDYTENQNKGLGFVERERERGDNIKYSAP